MNEPQTMAIAEIAERGSDELALVQAMPTEQLLEELRRGLELTVKQILRLSWIVRTLEERGQDLTGLRQKVGALLDYLRRVAHGQLLPEVVVRFAGSPMLVQAIAQLPTPDQQKLASGEKVTLVVPGTGDEGMTHRLLDPLQLSRDQVAQVFGKGRLRAEAEQIALLEDRRLKPAPARGSPAHGKCRADREKDGIVVNRTCSVPLADVLAALADLRDPEGAAPPSTSEDGVKLLVLLTPNEHQRIRIAAARGGHGVTMQSLARQALRMAGLLGGAE